jgi:hypothetical protein
MVNLDDRYAAPTGHTVEVRAFTHDGVVLRSLCGTDPELLLSQGVDLVVDYNKLETDYKRVGS